MSETLHPAVNKNSGPPGQTLDPDFYRRRGRVRVLITGTRAEDCREVAALLHADLYEVEQSIVSRAGTVEAVDNAADIHIVSLPQDFHAIRDSEDYTLSPPTKPLLYITSDNSVKTRLWCFRHGAYDVQLQPLSALELQYSIEKIIARDCHRFQKHVSEKIMLTFLSSMMGKNIQQLEPVLDVTMPYGYFYPEVAKVFGRTPCDMEFLEKMAGEGVLSRTVVNRVRICPLCAEMAVNYREVCPHCHAIDFVDTEVIHHFSCGHVGPLEAFRHGAELVCPKCRKTLRHIGLDYEKPSQHIVCNECGLIFSEPAVEAQCLRCGYVCDPNQTKVKNIYRYELSSLAQQAVNEQQIRGLNLSTLLKNQQTGIYSRQFLEHETKREMFRSNRTGNPFCLLMVRVDDFEHIRTQHAGKAAEFVASISNSISKNLRVLDVTCVWDTDLLAILLPETDGEGGKTVAARMNANVRGLEYLYSIHEPGITISLVAWDKKYTTPEEMFAELMKDLQE